MFFILLLHLLLQLLVFSGLCCLAAGAYFLFFRLSFRRRKMVGFRSPAFVFFLLACITTFFIFGPAHLQKPFTGDAEPLPNGYSLTVPFDRSYLFLSTSVRMVGSSTITTDQLPSRQVVNGYVRSIAVEGPLVLGAYNWHFNSPADKGTDPNQGYFLFDTRSGKVVDFRTEAELGHSVGHAFSLIDAESFRSSDSTHKRYLVFDRVMDYGLPLTCTLLFVFFLWKDLKGTTE
jgi:hypothetical protein